MAIDDIFNAICSSVHLKEVITFYSGAEFKGKMCRCMFHTDKSPSFSIYEKNGKELWYCHGCHIGGDAVAWVAKYFNINQFEAAKKLNEDFRLGLKIGGRLSKADREQIRQRQRQQKIETKWRNWQRQHELSEIDKVKALEQEKKQADLISDWQKSAELQAKIEFLDYQLESISERTDSEWQQIYCQTQNMSADQSEDNNFLFAFAKCEGLLDETEQEKNMDTRELFTPENLQSWLENNSIGIRYNELSKHFDITGLDNENQELLSNNMAALIHSRLKQADLYKGCTIQAVNDYISICGSRKSYNPVLEYLSKYQWDGKSRLDELYSIMNISAHDRLSRVLIRKWLMQSISLLHNNPREPFGADGCLTLCGGQGIGKSSLIRKLSMKSTFFKEGLTIDTNDKDSIIRAISGWIGEIGELESTLRKDIEKLKAFLTAATDEIRIPYARSATITPRRTSYGATCNSNEFLIDTSGNRRFWTIPVTDIDLQQLDELDVIQLWKEVQDIVSHKGLQAFRLTKDEQKALAERNGQHTRKVKAQTEIEEILSMTDTKKFHVINEYQTVAEFKTNFYAEIGGPMFTLDIIGKALEAAGIKAELKRIGGKVKRVRLLPKRIWH
ncbi:MAG: hypothetical protein IIT46_05855 [Lachnospiraceae bacterium]|nr:hypothetical protein [Lachnospiraceae bacterium]